jgi:GH18 family chitinase
MRPALFNSGGSDYWPLFTSVEEVRPKFSKGTAIMVAIGGWGDTEGFSVAAASVRSRRLFAQNVAKMIASTGADGVDIDWEYPGGNGEDYKKVPNSEKAWEIEAYPKLLQEIRSAIGPQKLMSAAVPGLPRDMLAFQRKSIMHMNTYLDFFNIMTYDLMNRRDNITKHHTGVELSMEAIDTYLSNGVPPSKANLGFAFYIKWYKTDPQGDCDKNPIGCKTVLMEDPDGGDDLGQAGAFSWADNVPSELAASYGRAMEDGKYDETQGGHYYWDRAENIWWSWDTPAAIKKKFPEIVKRRSLGGVFAWGLGEDSEDWRHLHALNTAVRKHVASKEHQLEL